MMAMTMAQFPQPARPSRAAHEELDPAMIDRCRARDPMAFRAFVVRYERPVFALLSRMMGPGAHVEDLAQETFLRAYRALPDFDARGSAKLSTWLLTIAMRLALDARKRRSFSTTPISDASEVAEAAGTPESDVERRQLGIAIARAAEALPDEQRAAFVLAEFHGMSIAEIADALGVPENTAKTRLFRAREKLRAELGTAWRTP
jgi:RNA polymerase sigma-70 factor (ECF subfamily)